MLYVPMFKCLRHEVQLMREENHYFSNSMIPLLEILREHLASGDFARDPITGEFKKKNERRYREKYVDTLPYYNEFLRGKKAFIDYFRFSVEVYRGGGIDPECVSLSLQLNDSEVLYINKLKNVGNYPNLIPVLSIKKAFLPRTYNPVDVVAELQTNNTSIAVRLDDVGFARHALEIAPLLRANDYFMFDIREQNVDSKVMEIKGFDELTCDGHKILLNSPRHRRISNDQYPHRQETVLINNSARDINSQYNSIKGYGDYCGMKDKLSTSGGNGRGTAIAFFYMYESNRFRSYVHEATNNGISDYRYLVPVILEDAGVLDPNHECPAIQQVRSLSARNSTGGWTTWHMINILRYLSQMSQNA